MNIFLVCISIFVGLIGLSELIHTIKLSCLSSKNLKNKIMLYVLTDVNTELDFEYILEQINWNGYKHFNKVICINKIKSDEKQILFKNLTSQNGISFISEDELINQIK